MAEGQTAERFVPFFLQEHPISAIALPVLPESLLPLSLGFSGMQSDK